MGATLLGCQVGRRGALRHRAPIALRPSARGREAPPSPAPSSPSSCPRRTATDRTRVRKAEIEVRLERQRARLHEPGAVVVLRVEQELDTAPVRGVGRGIPCLAQGDERLAGGKRRARHRGDVRPPAIGWRGNQLLHSLLRCARARGRPCEALTRKYSIVFKPATRWTASRRAARACSISRLSFRKFSWMSLPAPHSTSSASTRNFIRARRAARSSVSVGMGDTV